MTWILPEGKLSNNGRNGRNREWAERKRAKWMEKDGKGRTGTEKDGEDGNGRKRWKKTEMDGK